MAESEEELKSLLMKVKEESEKSKNPPATAGDIGDVGLIPGLGRSPGEGHVNPLQCYCLEDPMGRGAWQATAHGVPKSQIQLK